MLKLIFFFLFGSLVSTSVHAQMFISQWAGESELYIGDKLYCSSDVSKNPIYQPASKLTLHGFSVHRGADGWLWPIASGGCANGWLNSYFELQEKSYFVLSDKNGNAVGTVSMNQIVAENFYAHDPKTYILKLQISSATSDDLQVYVQFKKTGVADIFEYRGTFTRFKK